LQNPDFNQVKVYVACHLSDLADNCLFLFIKKNRKVTRVFLELKQKKKGKKKDTST